MEAIGVNLQRSGGQFVLSNPVRRAVAPAANSRAWWSTMEALLRENLSEK